MHCTFLIMILIVIICPRELICSTSKKGRCYQNFCDKFPGKYPIQKIKSLLKHQQKFTGKMEPMIEPATGIFQREENQILMRARTLSEENLCKSRMVTIAPRYDIERNLTIINIPGGFEQKIIYEICASENGKCSKSDIFDFETSCKQLFQNVRFLFLDGHKLKYKSIPVPNACVCVYRRRQHNSRNKEY